MSKKVVSLLAAFFVFSLIFYLSVTRETRESARSLLTPLGEKTFLEATRIKIYQGPQKKGFELVKEDGHWVILSDFRKPAKEGLVEEFLETFARLSGEERARGEKYFSRFGVGEKEGLHVIFEKDGQVLAHFILGKRGPRWESSFIRREGEEKIYLVPVNLLAKLEIWEEDPAPPKEEAFLDLEILTLPVEEVKELAFKGPDISWRLKLEGKKYLFEEAGQKKELSLEEGKKFLRELFPLLAEGVVPPGKFQGSEGALSYVLRDGRKGKLYLACQEEECLVKRGEFVFRVKKENLKALFSPLGVASEANG